MFTGLIRDVGTVTDVQRTTHQDIVFSIQTALPARDLELGTSIACDGACLTATDFKDGVFTVHAAAETCAVTNVGQWRVGSRVNLEPSLRVGDALGGHLVSGHVDGLARVVSVESVGEGWRIVVQTPTDLHKFMAVKGSVTLNGVSLTVNEVGKDWFSVLLIPHTWDHTNLHEAVAGATLHIEIDTIARYTARLLGDRTTA